MDAKKYAEERAEYHRKAIGKADNSFDKGYELGAAHAYELMIGAVSEERYDNKIADD